ncbi:hypothetical protein K435DRAFT_881278 [Dendrothele bispora CBS 962.96]|uniref:Uncharacterized protein n=1 Tax=Dendrothele bispora (strain CBS 962.96) TaxID=1314807 RepID=A0A4S8KIL6_DENBC|nr:hypothetical protein K435DRAFT_881278 [Dendrothele bispora CBS 962.96]
MPTSSTLQGTTDLSTFFSSEQSTETFENLLSRLENLPLSKPDTIRKLTTYSREAFIIGARSVLYAHLSGETTLFPLWIISWWDALSTHFQDFKKPWLHVSTWVVECRSSKNHCLRQEADITFQLLNSVSYNQKTRDGVPFARLWRLLGTFWMNSTAIEAMLDVLRATVEVDEKLASRFWICNTDITEKVVGFSQVKVEML